MSSPAVVVEELVPPATQQKENRPNPTKASKGQGKRKYVPSPLTDLDKERLITLVSEQPHLWDQGDKDYKDTEMKENTWRDLSTKMMIESGLEHVGIKNFPQNPTLADAKLEFKSLRDTYTATKRKLEGRSGQAAVKMTTWKFYEQMRFLEGIDGEESFFDSMFQGQAPELDVELLSDDDMLTDPNRYEPQSNEDDGGASLYSGFVDNADNAGCSTGGDVTRSSTKRRAEPQKTSTPRRKPKVVREMGEQLDQVVEMAKNMLNQTEEETFGLHIAQQLKKLHGEKKVRCMKALNDCIFEFTVD